MAENFDWKSIKTNVATWIIIGLIGLSVTGWGIALNKNEPDKSPLTDKELMDMYTYFLVVKDVNKRMDRTLDNVSEYIEKVEDLKDFMKNTNDYNHDNAEWFRSTADNIINSLEEVEPLMRSTYKNTEKIKDKLQID